MKVSNKELLEINAALVYLSQEETDAWLKVSRNIKLIKPHIVSWDESNKEIISKHSVKDSDGKPQVNGDLYDFGKNKKKAEDDYKALMEEQINVNFVPIKHEELTKDGETARLNAVNVESLLDVVIID